MVELLKQTLKLLAGDISAKSPFKSLSERQLVELESEIGRQLFGPIPADRRRDFFNVDAYTWIWYEGWTEAGATKSSTTRYEVRPQGILKTQDSQGYRFIEGEELRNLHLAVRLYYEQAMRKVYKRDPYTGKPLCHLPPATM